MRRRNFLSSLVAGVAACALAPGSAQAGGIGYLLNPFWTGSAPVSNPTFDSTYVDISSVNSTGMSSSAPFSTDGPNRLVTAFISYGSGYTTTQVSSVTITLGGTTLTLSRQSGIANPTFIMYSLYANIEIWTCVAAAQFNPLGLATTTAVNFTTNVEDARAYFIGIAGLANPSSPSDPNVSLPASAYNTSVTTPPPVTFSTTDPVNLLLFVETSTYTSLAFVPAGYTLLYDQLTGGGSGYCRLHISYKIVTSPQSGVTVQDGTPAGANWTVLVNAFR